ncbi:MAG: hypothetical protein Q4A32_06045 [Lachnospiraceae bacterium]|nr:hypothetical protein [Lachnospiraceae bacterium]
MQSSVTFTISLAEVPVAVSVLYPSTKNFCRDYLTDKEPICSVNISRQDVGSERQRAEAQRAREGASQRHVFSDAYLETLALYRKLALPLLDCGAFIFHGSVLAVDGRAYLFTAPSGTGKTTHTRLWMDQIPGAAVLNGDKPLLRVTEREILACGTPWQGKENYGCNMICPLEAVCILQRSGENHIEPVTMSEALAVLIQQTHRPEQPEALCRTLDLVGRMGSRVKLYRLGCNMEPEAAWVSYEGMRSIFEAD